MCVCTRCTKILKGGARAHHTQKHSQSERERSKNNPPAYPLRVHSTICIAIARAAAAANMQPNCMRITFAELNRAQKLKSFGLVSVSGRPLSTCMWCSIAFGGAVATLRQHNKLFAQTYSWGHDGGRKLDVFCSMCNNNSSICPRYNLKIQIVAICWRYLESHIQDSNLLYLLQALNCIIHLHQHICRHAVATRTVAYTIHI